LSILMLIFMRVQFAAYLILTMHGRRLHQFSMFHRNLKYELPCLTQNFLRCTAWKKSFCKTASVGADDDRVASKPIGLFD